MSAIEKKEFYKELFSLAIPIGFQNLLIALIGATDALMLGRLSQDAVSAVSLANQIVFVMNLFIGAVVGGGGALIAQYWGKEDKTMVKNLFCMILKWSSADTTKDWMKMVLPMLGSSLTWGLSISMHSLIMGHLSSDATAAASITSVVQELITCVCKGVSAGAGIIIGKLLGKSMFDKAKVYGRKLCHISIWVGVIHILLLCIIGPIATIFFLLTETAKKYLIIMLIFTGIYVLAYSINTVIVCGIFPAGGDAKYDAISVFIATWCVALPLALLGTFVFHWNVIVVYVLMCIDEIIKVPFLYPRYKKYLWLNNLTREEM